MTRRLSMVLAAVLVLAGCGFGFATSPEQDDGFYLRITNATGTTITVVVGPDSNASDFVGPERTVDFGQLSHDSSSPHREVNSRFTVTIDGVSIQEHYALSNWSFGIDSTPSRNWTLTLYPGHWDLSADL